jgi:hypothetical protein
MIGVKVGGILFRLLGWQRKSRGQLLYRNLMRDKIVRCHFLNEIIRNLSEVLVSEGICDCVCCVCVCVCVAVWPYVRMMRHEYRCFKFSDSIWFCVPQFSHFLVFQSLCCTFLLIFLPGSSSAASFGKIITSTPMSLPKTSKSDTGNDGVKHKFIPCWDMSRYIQLIQTQT